MKNSIRPKGQELKEYYAAFASTYEKITGIEFDYKRGEKTKVRSGFDLFCQQAGVVSGDKSIQTKMINCFLAFVVEQSEKWVRWTNARRQNYIGFCLRKDDMAIYIARVSKKNTKPPQPSASSRGVVGSGYNSDLMDF